MSKEHLVLVEHKETITHITLNRPEKRNALSIALLEQLCKAIRDTIKMANQRAIVLSGNGPIFCAGMDLKEASHHENVEPLANLIAKALASLYSSPLITIAAVNGAAIAGGAGLMSACDLVVAASDAKVGYPEIRHGLVAAQVSTLLTRQVPWRTVRELLLLGELIDSKRALEIGLINRIVPQKELLKTAFELAEAAAKHPPEAAAETKRLLSAFEPHAFNDDLRIAINIHRKARRSHAAKEGIRSFLEKKSMA
jgi:methylglutaconyl-CoA hydratase